MRRPCFRNSNETLMVANDDWQSDPVPAGRLTALRLALSNPKESGIYMTLSPEQFTAIITGKSSGTGIDLLEIYRVQ